MRKLAPATYLFAVLFIFDSMAHAETIDVSGKWMLRWGTSDNMVEQIVELEQDGETLTGKLWSDDTYGPITGTLEGTHIAFGVPKEQARNGMVPQFAGTVDGDTMKGEVSVGPAKMAFEASRQ